MWQWQHEHPRPHFTCSCLPIIWQWVVKHSVKISVKVGIWELAFLFSRYPTAGLVMQTTNLDSLFTMETRSYLCPVTMVTYLVELDATDLKLVLPQFNCWLNLGSGHCEEQLNIILIMLYCVETFIVYCTDLAPFAAIQEKPVIYCSAVVSWSRCCDI